MNPTIDFGSECCKMTGLSFATILEKKVHTILIRVKKLLRFPQRWIHRFGWWYYRRWMVTCDHTHAFWKLGVQPRPCWCRASEVSGPCGGPSPSVIVTVYVTVLRYTILRLCLISEHFHVVLIITQSRRKGTKEGRNLKNSLRQYFCFWV